MTLCTAALCAHDVDDGARASISFDTRVETFAAGADVGFKWEAVAQRWSLLFAGTVHAAKELANLYRAALRTTEKMIDGESVLSVLQTPADKFRAIEAERLTQKRHGMSYDDFLTYGKERLPEDLFRQTSYDVASQDMSVELILIGYYDNRFRLFKLSDGRVTSCTGFAVIGSGSYIAEPCFYQREHKEYDSVGKAVYTQYEAQTLGSIAPGVGKRFSIAVLEYVPDQERVVPKVLLEHDGMKIMEGYFKKWGPKPVENFHLAGDSLYLPSGFEVKEDADEAEK
jgi:hypothetical protein